MKNRNNDIDVLRGIGIIGMILIHVTAWYRGIPTAAFLWNYSQFAVQVFVFCSGYVFALKHFSSPTTYSITTVFKRAARLLIPYYTFLLIYLPVENLITNRSLSPSYILQSLTLTGGPDFNWAVLLFLLMAVVGPLMLVLFKQYRLVFWLWVSCTVLSSAAFLSVHITNYKLVMWLPWSLITLFSWYIATRKTWAAPFMVSLLLLLLSGSFLATTSSSLLFFDNKYPPNAYYLSYGALWILVLIKTIPHVSTNNTIRRFVSYTGKNSYELFFIHFLILTALRAGRVWFPWGVQLLMVLFGSLALLLVLKKFTASRR